MEPYRAGSAVAACPLFQGEGGGAIPTSALQLQIKRCDKRLAVELNRRWHSRLPEIANWQHCDAFLAEHEEMIYAIALWSHPVSAMLNGMGLYELRRMAVCEDAPKNTPSRFLSVMTKMIRREHPEFKRLISYQDPIVHNGIIYKAAGWRCAGSHKSGGFSSAKSRFRQRDQVPGDKVRWELDL